MAKHCNRAPRGWVCFLPRDHEGPCPAYRGGIRGAVARRLIQTLEKWSYGF